MGVKTWDSTLFENVMWSLGVHDIAVMVYLLGGDPVKVSSHGHCGLQPNIQDSVYLSYFPEMSLLIYTTLGCGMKGAIYNSHRRAWHSCV